MDAGHCRWTVYTIKREGRVAANLTWGDSSKMQLLKFYRELREGAFCL